MSTSTPKKAPRNWRDYEHGRSVSPSSDSQDSSGNGLTQGSPSSYTPLLGPPHEDGSQELRRRRSSFNMRLASFSSLRQAGGVNSIDNFARSWSRAAAFPDIATGRHASVVVEDEALEDGHRTSKGEVYIPPHKSLLRQHLEASPTQNFPIETAVEDPATREGSRPVEGQLPNTPQDDLYSITPHLASPFGQSYGTTRSFMSSRLSHSSMRHAEQLFRERAASIVSTSDKATEPLLVKQIQREDGTKMQVVVGRSTMPQTVFNSVNVLIGVGLLSLPLAVKYAGWVVGLVFLAFAAVSTVYTAKLLAICLDVDPSLVTYADVAYVSFGPKARILTSILFSLELIAASVALVVLFADSLDALISGWSILGWKILCGLVLIPLNFIPLRFLSVTSILGILCAFGIVLIVFIDGLIKSTSPGSLRDPMVTYAFPETWMTLPLSFGLFMSPWGGHSVFPNIYRDMRHPVKYGQALKYTYIFTYLLDVAMAIVGYLMYGESTRDEITSNILLQSGYPRALSIFIVIFIALIPLTKVPLNCRPIVSTIEIMTGLDPRAMPSDSPMHDMSPFLRTILKSAVRISVIVIVVLIAIVFPAFDSIMALMGSALCFTICVVLPCAFYLKIFGDEVKLGERILCWVMIILCSILAVVGTVWAILPKTKIGAE